MRRRKDHPRIACPRCHRFCRWRLIRYAWRSDCCHVRPPRPPGPLVLEELAEWTLPDGQRAIIALAREDLKPATITRSPTP